MKCLGILTDPGTKQYYIKGQGGIARFNRLNDLVIHYQKPDNSFKLESGDMFKLINRLILYLYQINSLIHLTLIK